MLAAKYGLPRAAPSETFAPISSGNWSGSGTYQALGGTWDDAGHVFTASAIENGTSGEQVQIDLADTQRILIEDQQTGWSVGVSFAASTSSTPLEQAMTQNQLNRAVARATGESPSTIRHPGFEIADPGIVRHDPEPMFRRPPWSIGTLWTPAA